MTTSREYEYISQMNLDLWKCGICAEPFIDPVSLPDPCDKTFCRSCIEQDFDRHKNACQPCLQNGISTKDLIPEGPKLQRIVNHLFVRCKLCGRTHIHRIDFTDHVTNQCPKRIVRCPRSDLGCLWKGTYDSHGEHLQICHYQHLRIVLEKLRTEINDLKERCANLEEKCRTLEQTNHQQRTTIDQLGTDLKQSQQQCEDRQKFFDQLQLLQTNYDTMQEEFKKMQLQQDPLISENQQLKEQTEKQQTELESLRMACAKLNETVLQHQLEQKTLVPQLQELAERCKKQHFAIETFFPEFQRLKPLCAEQETKIEQLTKAKNSLERENQFQNNRISQQIALIDQYQERLKRLEEALKNPYENYLNEETSNYENEVLEDLLSHCCNQGLVILSGQKLIDRDLNIIVRFAMQKEQVSKLILSNNQINAQGIYMMAPILYEYSSLRELNLSYNRLSDAGVLVIARALTKHNRTLTSLNLGANEISDDGVVYLTEMLEFNTTLRILGLQENLISDRGVGFLVDVLKTKNQTLNELSLYSNSSITDMSLNVLMDLLEKNQTLKTFWLWNCHLSDEVRQQLQETSEKKEHFELRIDKFSNDS